MTRPISPITQVDVAADTTDLTSDTVGQLTAGQCWLCYWPFQEDEWPSVGYIRYMQDIWDGKIALLILTTKAGRPAGDGINA